MRNIFRVFRSFAIALLLGGVSANALAVGYYAQAGKIYDVNNQEIQVRGINYFGFNSVVLVPQYLWAMGWKEQIQQIKDLGFNAVRVPFAPDTLYNTRIVSDPCPADLNPIYCTYINPGLNPELIGKTPLQILDLWMAEANRQGLYIMLDFHSVSTESLHTTWWYSGSVYNGRPEIDPVSGKRNRPFIYNGQPYTPENWRRDLAFVATRYAHLPKFFAIDLYNEPHDSVRWSTGSNGALSPDYYWKDAAEIAATAVLTANPNLLIFVEGINGNFDGREKSLPMGWGEDLQPHAYQPLNIPFNKLVLAPHTYGPDVYVKSSFNDPNFPNNLAADWHDLFGQFSPVHPVIIGEWGGKYGVANGTAPEDAAHPKDVAWQNALVDYLTSKNIHSSFYWCYTPNSTDTGGILDKNLNVREDKMALLRRHWGTGGGGNPGNPGTAENIYTDIPGTNWVVSGWSATSAEQASPVHEGTKSLAVQYTDQWGGFLFERVDGTNTPIPILPAAFTHVTFAVNPGATVSPNLASVVVHLNNGSQSKPLVNYLPGNSWVANQWQVVRIPLADLNSANANFNRVVIQSQVQTSGYGFSIDTVRLESGTATSPGASLTVFGDAMATQWALSPWSGTAAIQNQWVRTGTGAIKADANTWGGVDLDSRDANWVWFDQPGNRYTHLSFDISAGATVGAAMSTLEASLDLGSGLVARLANYVPSFAPNTWYHVEIPLSIINPNSVNFRRVKFQNQSQSNLTFYLDNVELVNR